MPDWLRLALLASMPPGVRARIRQIMQGLFDTAGRTAGAGTIALGRIATDAEAGVLQRWRERLQGWQRRIGYGSLAEDEPEDSPLRDVIYLGVLRGDLDPELALDATDKLLGTMGSARPPLTWNPLRWMAAVWVCAAFLRWRWGWCGGGPKSGPTQRGGSQPEPQHRPAMPTQAAGEGSADAGGQALHTAAGSGHVGRSMAPAAPAASGRLPTDSTSTAGDLEPASGPRSPLVYISCAVADEAVAAALTRALRVRFGIESLRANTTWRSAPTGCGESRCGCGNAMRYWLS